ncbi:MAG TPA: DUF3015 domain-containing protein [Gammaproteobacteria bacterium]|nr:DUF3015 domain-containing protein [Gammaproteobacteria bacterium]
MKTKWITVLGALVAVAPMTAMADNVGTCGWGSKLFDHQQGVAPQVLAVTTNGTSGSQTFGITSGTSGCTQDGVVNSTWKTAMFIDGNQKKLARDMAKGQGETLTSLASLIGIRDRDRDTFYRVAQEHFTTIFPSEGVSPDRVRASLHAVVANNARLAKYSSHI